MKKSVILLVSILCLLSCSSDDDNTEQFPENIFVGDITLTTQQEVNQFGAQNYTKVEGTLRIGSTNSNDLSDIFDLTSLSSLQEIGTDLTIVNNPNLVDLNGLNNINSINQTLYVHINSSLINLNALNNLNSISSSLSIRNNDSLENLDGLSNLNSVPVVSIIKNSSLISINGLNGISTLRNLLIEENLALNNINGLSNLVRVLGGLKLAYIPIDNIDALTNLLEVGSIDISATSITNLDGLGNVRFNDFLLNPYHYFVNNNFLSDFCELRPVLISDQQSNTINLDISGNLYNPTVQDIIDGNCSL